MLTRSFLVSQNHDAINRHATQVDYPEIAEGIFPRHRFMSAYEQKVNKNSVTNIW